MHFRMNKHLLFIFQIAVLVVDCQGTGDTENADVQLDTLIFYIGLQLASFQIINVTNRLKSDDITRLNVCHKIYLYVIKSKSICGFCRGVYFQEFNPLLFAKLGLPRTRIIPKRSEGVL